MGVVQILCSECVVFAGSFFFLFSFFFLVYETKNKSVSAVVCFLCVGECVVYVASLWCWSHLTRTHTHTYKHLRLILCKKTPSSGTGPEQKDPRSIGASGHMDSLTSGKLLKRYHSEMIFIWGMPGMCTIVSYSSISFRASRPQPCQATTHAPAKRLAARFSFLPILSSPANQKAERRASHP